MPILSEKAHFRELLVCQTADPIRTWSVSRINNRAVISINKGAQLKSDFFQNDALSSFLHIGHNLSSQLSRQLSYFIQKERS